MHRLTEDAVGALTDMIAGVPVSALIPALGGTDGSSVENPT